MVFNPKDLGELSYFLGVQVTRLGDSLHLNQHKYVMDLVSKARFGSSKLTATPMSSTTRLSKFDKDILEDNTLYRQLVRGLQYCVLTHPEIAFIVSSVGFCNLLHL